MHWSGQTKKTFVWVVLLGCTFTSLFCVYIYPNIHLGGDANRSSFVPVNKFGVRTFRNVCIEVARHPGTRTIQFKNSERTFTETKQIVIYDHVFNASESMRLSVSGSANSIWNWWDVSYRSSGIPGDSVYHRDKAAYFIAPTCPGNLHHFWEDEFRLLHSVVSATNRLYSGAKNQLLYRIPWDLEPDDLDCYDVRVYDNLLLLLNFETFHDVFYNMAPSVCFEHAVFGLADFSGTKRDASNFVLNKLGVSYDTCHSNVVTIIQRTTRKILNMNNLVNITKMEGFPDVRVVMLEDLSIEEQVRTVACSTILVGVQGAGLQWAIFMRPGSTLIEIAWPSKFWKYYFNGFVPAYNIYHRGVLANHLRVNWPAYQTKVRGGQIVPPEERALLLKSKPKSPDMDNIWKWADPIVEEKHYMFALRSHKYANSIKNHR